MISWSINQSINQAVHRWLVSQSINRSIDRLYLILITQHSTHDCFSFQWWNGSWVKGIKWSRKLSIAPPGSPVWCPWNPPSPGGASTSVSRPQPATPWAWICCARARRAPSTPSRRSFPTWKLSRWAGTTARTRRRPRSTGSRAAASRWSARPWSRGTSCGMCWKRAWRIFWSWITGKISSAPRWPAASGVSMRTRRTWWRRCFSPPARMSLRPWSVPVVSRWWRRPWRIPRICTSRWPCRASRSARWVAAPIFPLKRLVWRYGTQCESHFYPEKNHDHSPKRFHSSSLFGYVLYCPAMVGHFLDPPGNHPRGAIFPRVD